MSETINIRIEDPEEREMINNFILFMFLILVGSGIFTLLIYSTGLFGFGTSLGIGIAISVLIGVLMKIGKIGLGFKIIGGVIFTYFSGVVFFDYVYPDIKVGLIVGVVLYVGILSLWSFLKKPKRSKKSQRSDWERIDRLPNWAYKSMKKKHINQVSGDHYIYSKKGDKCYKRKKPKKPEKSDWVRISRLPNWAYKSMKKKHTNKAYGDHYVYLKKGDKCYKRKK